MRVDHINLLQRILAMKNVIAENEYYAITLLVNENDRIEFGTQTHWVGFTDDNCRYELREPSIVNPEWIIERWKSFEQPYIVVNNDSELLVFMLIGGNALVEKNKARKGFKEFLRDSPSGRSGALGFKSLRNLPSNALHRAPTPKLRMKVITRDNYRCVVCGRRPVDYTDIELHVHHIRPWANGGLTDEKNLITLCQTCHNGLNPHEDHNLFTFTGDGWSIDPERMNKRFFDGVAKYRKKISESCEQYEE